ncbi:MAG: oligosaccharide flippase family protein [Candidatus Fusobacterium pullicola]|uniref:Oligosaccharide flippase family protein n=1 Tax=Candidatus Fusobacterium pullicola TaxID=2838601 RepID=A0A9E2NWT2_9FUSO|nr:oligosaccharide flippase family protein [Candidatus Fusobacterium pullicola]
MNKYKKLGYNTLFILIGNIGSKLVSFLLLPFYTAYLSPELYGELNMITMTITFLTPLLTLQFATTVFRFANHQSEEKQNVILFIALVTVIPLILVVSLFAKNIIEYFKIDYITKYYKYILIIFIFSYLNSVLKEKIRTNSMVKLYSVIGIIETFITITLNIYLVPKFLVLGMIISMTYSTIIISIILAYFSNLNKVLKFKYWNTDIFKEMLKYSFPLIPNAIIWSILALADRIFLKYYYGLEEVGLYSVASKIPMILTVIFNIFYNSLQISMLDEYKKEGFDKFFYNIFYNISLIQMFGAIIIIILIKPVIGFIVADTYIEVWKYIPLFLLTILFNNYSAILGIKYLLKKDTKQLLKSSFVASIVNIGFNYLLVPKFGILGAIMATVIAYVALFYMRKKDTEDMINIEISFYLGNIIILLLSLLPTVKNLENYRIYLSFILIFLFIIIQKKYLLSLYNFILKKFDKRKV